MSLMGQPPANAAAQSDPDEPRGPLAATDLARLTALPVRRRRHVWSRWVLGVVAVVVVAWLLWTIARSKNLNWNVVGTFLFAGPILHGVVITLVLTIATFAIGFILGVVLAVMKISKNPVLSLLCDGYIWIFRGTPLIVQLIFWFNLALLFPRIGVAIPGTGIGWTTDANTLIKPFMAALIGLSLHTAAYMAEVVRGGFLAVPRGQVDAALAIGMTPLEAQRRIVIPQAVRVILPPLGNQLIDILKATAIVSVIGGGDLMTQSQQIYGQNYQVIALLVVASLWYLVMVTVATIGQNRLERWVAREQASGKAPRRGSGGRRGLASMLFSTGKGAGR